MVSILKPHVPLTLRSVPFPSSHGLRSAGGSGDETEDSPYSSNKAMPSSECLPSVHSGNKKSRAWCQLPSGDWALGTILSTSDGESIISLPEGKISKLNSEKLLPANPDILDGVDDLLQLSYLNEPSVLYNLQYRYMHDVIYTKAGPILVAINPFREVHLYGNDHIEAYRCKSIYKPHVYAIADTAFLEMTRDELNQSIIISGESGAGKTETAKIAMQYLATLGGGSGIENEILQSNPILEAFGNAKTSRNDNSSRFGKLIAIHFNSTGKISGAKIQTFLLEKSRVVQCAQGERSYHIFYQLCAGAHLALREKLNLKNADEYEYLKRSNCFSISGVDDAARFRAVTEAMNIVHISEGDQEITFVVLAAVLWLGNISFTVIDNENHVELVEDESAISVAKLIGCDIQELNLVLSTHTMTVSDEKIVQKLTLSQAIDTRDALAKSLYASLFEWLVEQINKSLEVGKKSTGRSISILDIYGFESFDKNSFEQFCINYANERLQQHFNRHLFKLEQEEYIQDGVDWAKIDFQDNQDCLSLFEKKPLGLLSLLDEESTFPNGTNMTFANKLDQHLSSNSCFRGERGEAFSVNHYAGEVVYDTSGFLEKNRDLLHMDSIQLLASCTCQLLPIFANKMLMNSEKLVSNVYRSTGADTQKLSVATKFKGQLFQLMQRLEATTPHFIRCIKPNNFQLPETYEQRLVLDQLRCCGVLEVVRISRSGYPTRMSHQKFATRYGFLLPKNVASRDPLSVSMTILHQFNIIPEMYQIGYTKLFFRTGQIGELEDTRNRTLHGILRVQSIYRGRQARSYAKERRRAIVTFQSFIRSENTRRLHSLLMRRKKAATILQRSLKAFTARKKFIDMHNASIVIQSVIRGLLVRRCSENSDLLNITRRNEGTMVTDSDHVPVSASIVTELQRRILKVESTLREKEKENGILQHRLHKYESRWSVYEHKMRSMEEVWQKQMRSLQSNLSVAKKSLSMDDAETILEDSAVRRSWDVSTNHIASNGPKSALHFPDRELNAGLNVISRLTEELEQRSQIFVDDANFLVEVKAGKTAASLNPERELRQLKQTFDVWKNDYNLRIREAKVIIHKIGNNEVNVDKVKKKWWRRLKNARNM